MMDDEIVDATKKGGIARFINHSCDPNCTAKIIKVEGTPRIVIYALKDIYKSEYNWRMKGRRMTANILGRRRTYLRLQVRARDRVDGPYSLPVRFCELQGLLELEIPRGTLLCQRRKSHWEAHLSFSLSVWAEPHIPQDWLGCS